jgi:MazG family protein
MPYYELERCIEVVKKLRNPQSGCPWDLEQTHESLLKYLIEESYEFIDAVEKKNSKLMEEEMGDVLLQVLLHTTLGEERRLFNLESSAKVLADKIIRRHPHVFGDSKEKISSEKIVKKWEEIKIIEKGKDKYEVTEKLLHAPALESSYRIGQKSTTLNFDWKSYHGVVNKIEEEWLEVKDELPEDGNFKFEKVFEEIGDLLFSIAQLARHLNMNPELALRQANKKFINRFNRVEDLVKDSGKILKDTCHEELESYWMRVKHEE